ncbi:MAG: hypothetical protein IPJ41_15380 [Phycisphaerales bacterium]|nr:hypothetical protein [Phycisphaerales bacterium]
MPSINNAGEVAFQASLRAGGSSVFVSRGGAIEPVVEPGRDIAEVVSHPALNDAGACCFYALTPQGDRLVALAAAGRVRTIAPGAGPLGPTINNAGVVAFRAASPGPDQSGICLADGASNTTIAQVGPRFSAFHGLPLVGPGSAVLFRADTRAGGQAIILARDGQERVVCATGERFAALGAFPAMNDAGQVAFAATLRSGESAIFLDGPGGLRMLLDGSGPFESFRGVLVDGAGGVVFYATPRAGSLGVYAGPDPVRDRLLGIGTPFLGSLVTEFALNPVSINEAGQITIRVALEDGRGVVVRGDVGGM